MAFSDLIDGAIAPFAPGWAARRMSSRAQLAAASAALDGIRQYDAGTRDRRTAGWRRDTTSADGENARYRMTVAAAGHDLVQNNKYAAAGVRQLTATVWGDGIAPQLTHPVKRIQQRAQDELDRWNESKVDGHGDWYGHGKVCVREMIVGGEGLTIWLPDANGPDGQITGAEGPQLDSSKNYMLNGGSKIVQGVQFNGRARAGYWLFDENPYDPVRGKASLQSSMVDAAHVDHLFERLRFGQTRGMSWLGAVAMTLRDIGDIEDAKRLQEKVQACLALVVLPGEQPQASPLGVQQAPQGDDGRKPLEETLRPGMIVRLKQGEQATVVNPTPSASTVDFIRQQIAAVSASMVPYHLMTGDTSQANYSGLRAAMNGSYSMVDDWQQNVVIPLLCRPAVQRRMRRLFLETGDARFLQVGATYALPVRRLVDPVKDLMGEIMEIRSGLRLISQSLGERGLKTDQHMAAIKTMNDTIDQLGLALDTDPRRLTEAGVLQIASGYLAPKGDTAAN